MDVSNHAFAVYHYLLDSATATSVTTSRRIFANCHIQLGGITETDHLMCSEALCVYV